MRIAYLVNTYPTNSQTFIRREIQALEAAGLEIERYAIRIWPDTPADEQTESERKRTRYILSGRKMALFGAFLAELVSNPAGSLRAIGACLQILRNAGGGLIRHIAYLLEAATLKRWTRESHVTHVHAHFSTNAVTVALLCERMGGPAYSFTAHGPDEFENWASHSLTEKISAARFVVAISDYCRVQLMRAAGKDARDKIFVVRCGVDPDEFSLSKTEFENNLNFVCVGRLCPQKAQTLIVEAVGIIAKDHPGVKVIMIGDGETRSEIENLIGKAGLHDNFTMLGWRSNSEVRQIMSSSRAFLLPSFAEGLPIVIMEALALGRPVISTYVAGIPELLTPACGWIIPAGSVEDIAKALRAAIETPAEKLAEMGREGRNRVLEAHDQKSNILKLDQLFCRFATKP